MCSRVGTRRSCARRTNTSSTLVRYVHLNPVRAGLAARAEDYPYSDHRAYLAGMVTELVDPTFVLGLIGEGERLRPPGAIWWTLSQGRRWTLGCAGLPTRRLGL